MNISFSDSSSNDSESLRRRIKRLRLRRCLCQPSPLLDALEGGFWGRQCRCQPDQPGQTGRSGVKRPRPYQPGIFVDDDELTETVDEKLTEVSHSGSTSDDEDDDELQLPSPTGKRQKNANS